MMTKGEVAARLEIGAARLIEKGHWKGGDTRSKGECVATSIPDGSAGWARHHALNALASNLGVDGWGGIYEWNDRPETTQEDAVQLMMTTAEKVRTGEIKLEGVF